ncbi:hypothetical protein A3731_08690 [Roseovarius sp. HI0049]|nr:hypothetical protein A3731_08690 [Roseovarius sp. HI0049]
MSETRIEILLHDELHRAAKALAARRDISTGQLVRDLLAKEITRTRNAKPPVRADERLLAPLRARLADDLAHATGWADLDTRLNAKGYSLRAAGGGLALHDHPGGRRLCKASELGFSYARLMRRFGAPFPGHSHTWLAERMLAPAPQDDCEVIEPF